MGSSDLITSHYLSFLIIILNLRDCECNHTESYIQDVVSTSRPGELKLPKLLVFSLDLVIWPFRVDSDVVTPIKKNKKTGQVQDFVMKDLGVFSEAVDTLSTLYLKKYRLAAVSDSPDVETNTKLLLFFNLYNYFPIQEMFGGPKKQHLEVIHRATHIPYQDIFYFDTENDQLNELRNMGVNVIEVDASGLKIQDFDKAFDIYNGVAVPNATEIPTSTP